MSYGKAYSTWTSRPHLLAIKLNTKIQEALLWGHYFFFKVLGQTTPMVYGRHLLYGVFFDIIAVRQQMLVVQAAT